MNEAFSCLSLDPSGAIIRPSLEQQAVKRRKILQSLQINCAAAEAVAPPAAVPTIRNAPVRRNNRQPAARRPIIIADRARTQDVARRHRWADNLEAAISNPLWSRLLREEHHQVTRKMRLHRWAQKIALTRSIMDNSLRHVCDYNFQTKTLLGGANRLEAIEFKLNIVGGPSQKAMATFWTALELHKKRMLRMAKLEQRERLRELQERMEAQIGNAQEVEKMSE